MKANDKALHKHTAARLTSSGRLEFVHAYHSDPLTRAALAAIQLVFYLPIDSWGAIFYTTFVYGVFSIGIWWDVYNSIATSTWTACIGALQLVITQVVVGHNVFQGFNAPFEFQEAFVYTPFYFAIRFLRLFGYAGHEEEFQRVPGPHDTPVGRMGVVEQPIAKNAGIVRVSNQCKNSCSAPSSIFFPSTLQDLVKIVLIANERQRRVRVIGKGHTFNKIALCDDGDLLVRTDWLRTIQVDADRMRAKVQAGVTVGELDEELAKHGLCVRTNVILTSVTWGGITQTGSHGGGHAPVCEMVQSLTLVDGTGQVKTLCRKADGGDNDMFQAAVQGLGTCGLLYELEVQVEPMVQLQMTSQPRDDWPTASYVEEAYEATDQFEYFLLPNNKSVLRSWELIKDNVEPPFLFLERLKHELVSMFHHLSYPFLQLILRSYAVAQVAHRIPYHRYLLRHNQAGPVHEVLHYSKRLQDMVISSCELALPLADLDKALAILKELEGLYSMRGRQPACYWGRYGLRRHRRLSCFLANRPGRLWLGWNLLGLPKVLNSAAFLLSLPAKS
ncbi:hypothetical protein ACHAXT_010453 [Thalassiosira profunda]